jgi:hypothetical protein
MKVRLDRIAVTALAALAIAIAQPRVTPLWSLYVGDRALANREVLFLEPFPSAGSCDAAARALGTTGQWTACRGRLTLSVRQSVRLVTLQQEFVPGGAWERLEALCGLDRGAADDARPSRARVRGGSAPRSRDLRFVSHRSDRAKA